MRIRTLDQDLNSHQLDVSWGGNGDVYVTIYQNGEHHSAMDEYRGLPVSVRIGMAGSGQHIPARIGRLLAELANAFSDYEDCKFESDGSRRDFYDHLDQYT